MPKTYKVLGQTEPAATTLSTLYTVPAATSTVVSTLSVCNRTNTVATFRIAVQPAGASIADQHYLCFDSPVNAYDTLFLTVGLTLAATDVISVYASSADVAFHAYGSELT